MNEDKKVSIITGIYNCAPTLDTAIESILAQTYLAGNYTLVKCSQI